MFLTEFYLENSDGISFSRKQSSDFAKNVANDFNPIHDEDAKRFCVPGDLLFSIMLYKQGLSQNMRFEFSGMVTEDVTLTVPDTAEPELTIYGNNGKEYLSIKRRGDRTDSPELIERLIRQYVAFSGQTFPHILVPLMEKNNVMINPSRPFVVYESMEIDFSDLAFNSLTLKMSNEALEVVGKRGNVSFTFDLLDGDRVVGTGVKNMVLSGLRPYEQDNINHLVNIYNTAKESHLTVV